MTFEQAKKIAETLLTCTDKQLKAKLRKFDLEDQLLIALELGFMQDALAKKGA